MEPLTLIGYSAALAVGLSLGLTGSGGSILTVPILVYLMRVNPLAATGYSLFVVGITSLVGVVSYLRGKLVDIKTALIFGVPSLITIYLTRSFLIPALPEVLIGSDNFNLTTNVALMMLFAVLMIAAAFSMIFRKSRTNEPAKPQQPSIVKLMWMSLQGAVVGFLTGLVGAGGGFLIIPALVFFMRLPMKKAIGTSLLIIAVNSLVGFWGELTHRSIEWSMLLIFTTLAIAGILLGHRLAGMMDGNKLKKGFGWFVLAMGFYIVVKEIFIS